MKVCHTSEIFTFQKTLILQLQLTLELSQFQKILSTYTDFLFLFAEYSYLFKFLKNEPNSLQGKNALFKNRFITQDPARDGGNWYAYCNNSPLNFKDPTGLSTQVDEKTGTIIGATDDGDCGVYAYPTFDGQRAEGPAFPIGLTGTPGYFVSTPSNPGNIQIAGQEQNYIGKNINDYGSGFAYGDFQFTLPKEDIIGTALSTFQDYVDIFQGCLNPLGDIVSYASIGLNIASVTCTLTGNVTIAECLDLAAATCDIAATGLYFASGNKEKAAVALTATLMDFVPGPYKFSKGANRYISSTTGRFVSTSLGRQGAILPKTFGMALGLNLLKINEE